MRNKKGKERQYVECGGKYIHTIERFCQREQCSSCDETPLQSISFQNQFRVATNTKRRYLNSFLRFVGFFVMVVIYFVFFNTRILARQFAAAADEDQD